MPSPILRITNGTDSVNLLQNNAFCLKEWRPGRLQMKGGGIYSDLALADYRRLTDYRWASIIDTFVFAMSAATMDQVIHAAQDMDRLLVQAANYWKSSWSNSPVWLERRGGQETNTAYALVIGWKTADDNNPFDKPFYNCMFQSAQDNLIIIIEHEAWSENPPGSSTAVEVGQESEFDGETFGNVTIGFGGTPVSNPVTAAHEAYFGNSSRVANLTDIYIDDGGVFSANLIGTVPPFALTPAVPAAGDFVYFGCDSTVADSGPFNNIVFDLSVAATGITGQWEYFDGVGWSVLTVVDQTSGGTHPLENTGVNGVFFAQPSGWATRAVNGVTAYWVRLNILTAVGATGATQQTNYPYVVTWPYIEIQSDQIDGDIPALANLLVHPDSIGVSPLNFSSGLIVGLRSVDRGSDFNAYINLADEQNHSGITVTVGAASAFAIDTRHPTGRTITYTPAGADAVATRATVAFDNTIADQYAGRFHCYLRVLTSGSATTFTATIRILDGAGFAVKTLPQQSYIMTAGGASDVINYFDFGQISLPPYFEASPTTVGAFSIEVQLGTNNNTDTINLVDLILLPADEWAGSFVALNDTLGTSPFVSGTGYLQVGSLTSPKSGIPIIISYATGNTLTGFIKISASNPMLQTGEQQRLWTFTPRQETLLDELLTAENYVGSMQVLRNQRYMGMRGGR